MKYRKLRIACSVACGIACLLLIALWGRSYWAYDHLLAPVSAQRSISAWSGSGELTFVCYPSSSEWSWTSFDADSFDRNSWSQDPNFNALGFGFFENNGSAGLYMPHWCPVLLAAVLAASVWLPWRFSLRTLLIVSTVAALTLGLAAMILRRS